MEGFLNAVVFLFFMIFRGLAVVFLFFMCISISFGATTEVYFDSRFDKSFDRKDSYVRTVSFESDLGVEFRNREYRERNPEFEKGTYKDFRREYFRSIHRKERDYGGFRGEVTNDIYDFRPEFRRGDYDRYRERKRDRYNHRSSFFRQKNKCFTGSESYSINDFC